MGMFLSKLAYSEGNDSNSVRQSQKVQYANSRWPFVMGKQRLADIFNLHIEPFGSDVQNCANLDNAIKDC